MSGAGSPPTYSVVVPVYNAGGALLQLVERLAAVFEETIEQSYEIVIVDDGSTAKDTERLLRSLATNERIQVIRLTRNFGKPGAVMCGFQHCNGDWIVTIDDDLQQRPEDIPKLLELKHHDVVIGTHPKKSHSLAQRSTSWTKHWFDRIILGYRFPLGPMKVFRRHVVDGMLLSKSNRPFIPALIRDVTDDVVPVSIAHDPSAYVKSRYTFRMRWRQFSNLLMGNSALVMKLIGWIGFTIMVLSLLFALAIVVRKTLNIPTETGWSSVMVTMLLLGGLNLGATSLLGQYLVRILDVTNDKPAFIVREVFTGLDEVPDV